MHKVIKKLILLSIILLPSSLVHTTTNAAFYLMHPTSEVHLIGDWAAGMHQMKITTHIISDSNGKTLAIDIFPVGEDGQLSLSFSLNGESLNWGYDPAMPSSNSVILSKTDRQNYAVERPEGSTPQSYLYLFPQSAAGCHLQLKLDGFRHVAESPQTPISLLTVLSTPPTKLIRASLKADGIWGGTADGQSIPIDTRTAHEHFMGFAHNHDNCEVQHTTTSDDGTAVGQIKRTTKITFTDIK